MIAVVIKTKNLEQQNKWTGYGSEAPKSSRGVLEEPWRVPEEFLEKFGEFHLKRRESLSHSMNEVAA